MRRNLVKPLLTCLLLLGSIAASMGQAPITLMDYTNQWRYLLTNQLPAGGWTNVTYTPANSWPIGPGVHAFPAGETMPTGVPSPAGTTLATNIGNSYITTFYFRSSVTITSNPNFLIITASAVIDDGAVFYVNGREVQRVRVAAGAVSHGTLANAGGEVASRIDTFVIPSTNFVQGNNVIAVSVHQDGNASSDVVFSLKLTAQVVTPVTITQQPQDQTVDVGLRATFNVDANGDSLRYQWFVNNSPIQNATNASYQTPVATLAMNGWVYHVVVSNIVSSVRSSNAVLSVIVDRNGPLMTLLATEPGFTNRLRITFNETLATPGATHTTITNRSNFVLHELGTTNKTAITNVVWAVTQLRIFLDGGVDFDKDYVLCVKNMEDTRGNFTASDCIGLSIPQSTNLVTFGSSGWRIATVMTDNHLDNTNWHSPSFVEDPNDIWGDGTGMFWFDQVNFNPTCSSPFDEIANNPSTQYFRKQFTLASAPGGTVSVSLNYVADDAAVFYINGVEIHRGTNMPPTGPIGFDTRPLATSDFLGCLGYNVPIDPSILNVGANNVFAAELHQVADQGAQNDMVFDAALTLNYQRIPMVPNLSVARTFTYVTNAGVPRITATNVVVTWTGGGTGWRLQHATSPTGPWTALTTFGNRYQTQLSQQGPRRFYRIVNP